MPQWAPFPEQGPRSLHALTLHVLGPKCPGASPHQPWSGAGDASRGQTWVLLAKATERGVWKTAQAGGASWGSLGSCAAPHPACGCYDLPLPTGLGPPPAAWKGAGQPKHRFREAWAPARVPRVLRTTQALASANLVLRARAELWGLPTFPGPTGILPAPSMGGSLPGHPSLIRGGGPTGPGNPGLAALHWLGARG